jgi:hypothetical protein
MIGSIEKGKKILSVEWKGCNTYTQGQSDPGKLHGSALLNETMRNFSGMFIFGVGKNTYKLISTITEDSVIFPEKILEKKGKFHEYGISPGMTICVVYILEMVQINDNK